MPEPLFTPCHVAPLIILTSPEGPAYLNRDVPSEILCSAEGCYNSWSATGEPSEYNQAGSTGTGNQSEQEQER